LVLKGEECGFDEIGEQILESATVEGANEWQVFRYVMFPLAGRALLAGIILTWARALGEFGATILFAGNLEGKTQTMPLAIYIGFETELGIAIALSVMLMVVSIVLLGLMRSLERRNNVDIHPE
jgi:molybdate transport system permease protein